MRTEYLSELRQQHKLLTKPSKDTDINEGDIVLIKDDKKPRQLWTIGKVEQLIISKDNKVRGAEVRTPSSNSLKRPISSLYPIETVNCGENNITNNVYNLEKPRREAAELATLKIKYLCLKDFGPWGNVKYRMCDRS